MLNLDKIKIQIQQNNWYIVSETLKLAYRRASQLPPEVATALADMSPIVMDQLELVLDTARFRKLLVMSDLREYFSIPLQDWLAVIESRRHNIIRDLLDKINDEESDPVNIAIECKKIHSSGVRWSELKLIQDEAIDIAKANGEEFSNAVLITESTADYSDVNAVGRLLRQGHFHDAMWAVHDISKLNRQHVIPIIEKHMSKILQWLVSTIDEEDYYRAVLAFDALDMLHITSPELETLKDLTRSGE